MDDCVSGFISGVKSDETVGIYNIGSEDRCNVLEIAEIVKKEMGDELARIELTGGVDGGRGWRGDVKVMQLDMTKLRQTGWKPKYSSVEAVRLTSKSVIDHSK